MTTLIDRHVSSFAREALETFPALVIQGARQVGKSTFARMITEGRPTRLLTLDEPGSLAAAREDPTSFVNQFSDGTLVIDEVQRAPDLILPLKAAIDRDRRASRFVLTGSSELLRYPGTPDSLAGRAITIALRGLTRGEAAGSADDIVARIHDGVDAGAFSTETTRFDYVAAIAAGGYPEARSLSGRLRRVWFDSYVERLLQRDATDLAPRTDRGRLASVLRLLAANQAGEVVRARIARDAAIPESSMTAYIDLLSALFLVDLIPPWTPNLTSRESSRPKAIVSDSGLALRLSRVDEKQLLPLDSPFIGGALEGFVAAALLAQRAWSKAEYELYHFRDRNGLEVDLVAELSDGNVIAFEVKTSATVKSEHFAGLRALRDRLGDRFTAGFVLNTASSGSVFADRLSSLPVAALWEL